jgi:GT2 family glycosyltransferase
MDLSAVIINYKSRDALAECLQALEADARNAGLAIETVVIDNDSRDGTAEMLAARYPGVRLVANAENVGYARAVNQGIAATCAPFVLVLNPDCIPQAGALGTLRDELLAHPKLAVVGPRLLNTDGSLEYSARSFPTPLTALFNRYSLLTRLFPSNPWSRRYLMSDWDHTTRREVDWLSGACLLVRREAIAKVGGMDEAFFMFNEDVDWCHRFRDAGWANGFVPGATVTHHVGASRGKVAPRVIWSRHLGMLHYFRKHHSRNPLLAAAVGLFVVLRAGVMLVRNALRAG